MSAVVASVLSTYLQVFLKEYNKELLDVSIFSGEVTLKSIRLNEKVLQYLAGAAIPPSLEIVSVSCGFLKVKVPWRKLKTEPISVEMDDVLVDIAERSEPVSLPSMPKLTKLLQKKPDKRKEEKVRKDSFVQGLLEDMALNVSGIVVKVSFLPRPGSDVGPSFTLNLATVLLRTTDSKFELVPLAEARKEAYRTVGGEVILHKELLLGSMWLIVESHRGVFEVLKMQPTNFKAVVQRKPGVTMPTEFTVSAMTPLVLLAWENRNSWAATIDVLEGIASSLRRVTSNAAPPQQQPPSAVAPLPGVSPPQVSPSLPSGVTQLQHALLKLADADVPSTGDAIGAVGGAGEDIDRELEELAHEFEVEEAPQESESQQPSATEFPVMNFTAEVLKTNMKWAGMCLVEVTDVTAGAVLEKVELPESVLVAAGTAAALDPKKRLTKQATLSFGVGALAISSLDVGKGQVPILSVTELPFIDASITYRATMKTHRASAEFPALELFILVAPMHVNADMNFLRHAHEYLSFRKWSLQPRPQASSAPPSKSFQSSSLWWINSSKATVSLKGCRVTIAGSTSDSRDVVGTVGRVTFQAATAPDLVSVFRAHEPADGETDTSADLSDTPRTRSRSNSTASVASTSSQPEAAHTLILCTFVAADSRIGSVEPGGELRYLANVLEIGGDIAVFQPLPLIASLLRKQTLQDIEKTAHISSVDELPAISVTLRISPIVSVLSPARSIHTYHGVATLLGWLSGVFSGSTDGTKATAPPRDAAVLPATPADDEQAEGKTQRTVALRKAMNARLAAGLPYRAFVTLTVSPSQISFHYRHTFMQAVVDRIVGMPTTKGWGASLKQAGSILHSLLMESPGDADVGDASTGAISLSFSRMEFTAAYVPDIPEPLVALVSPSKRTRVVPQHPLLEVEAALKGFRFSASPSPGLPFGITAEPLRPTEDISSVLSLKYAFTAGEQPRQGVLITLARARVEARGSPSRLLGVVFAMRPISDPEQAPKTVTTFDMELCDVDYGHGPVDGGPVWAHFALLPRSEATIATLQELLRNTIAASAEQHRKTVREFTDKLRQSQVEYDSLEQRLVEAKVANGALRQEADEKEATCGQLSAEIAETKIEIDRLRSQDAEMFSMLQTRFSDVPVAKFQRVIASLSEQIIHDTAEKKDLLQETMKLGLELKLANEHAEVELERFQKQKEQDERALRDEVARLKADLEEKTKQLAEAQATLLERHDADERSREEKAALVEQLSLVEETRHWEALRQLNLAIAPRQTPAASGSASPSPSPSQSPLLLPRQAQPQPQQAPPPLPSGERARPTAPSTRPPPPPPPAAATRRPAIGAGLLSPAIQLDSTHSKRKKLAEGFGRFRDKIDRKLEEVQDKMDLRKKPK